jgi:hypothetical protein
VFVGAWGLRQAAQWAAVRTDDVDVEFCPDVRAAKTTRVSSGDQAGDSESTMFLRLMRVSRWPSPFTRQIELPVTRTIRRPSADHDGEKASALVVITRRMRLPSGEIVEIHAPLPEAATL